MSIIGMRMSKVAPRKRFSEKKNKMELDQRQKHNKTLKFSLNALMIFFSIAWAAIEFFWRLPFTFGDVGGIYWFFYYFEKLSTPLATLAFVMTLLLVVIALVMRATKRDQYSSVAKNAGALFLTSLIIGIATFKPIQPAETLHLDALEIHGRLYYLTAYSTLDTNYALYRCDLIGIFCKQVYRSDDFMPRSFYAKLVHYPDTDELAVEVKNEGEIYRYKLP